jgi:hypothetical protein
MPYIVIVTHEAGVIIATSRFISRSFVPLFAFCCFLYKAFEDLTPCNRIFLENLPAIFSILADTFQDITSDRPQWFHSTPFPMC